MSDKELETTANSFALELLTLVKEFQRRHKVNDNTMGIIMLATYVVLAREFNTWSKRHKEKHNGN